jgi:hypothetical protein
MNLVEERNHWRQQIEAGEFIPHPLLEDYRENRNSDLWRCSRIMERVFEYIVYLEEQLAGVTVELPILPKMPCNHPEVKLVQTGGEPMRFKFSCERCNNNK